MDLTELIRAHIKQSTAARAWRQERSIAVRRAVLEGYTSGNWDALSAITDDLARVGGDTDTAVTKGGADSGEPERTDGADGD
jgi:hypothetical protein